MKNNNHYTRSQFLCHVSKTNLGSSWFELPRPYNGITLSRLIPDLQTGHTFLFGRVSSHWCKQGQLKRWQIYIKRICYVNFDVILLFTYQNKCPHMLITASLAVSKQILHSYICSSVLLSSSSFVLELSDGAEAELVLAITSVFYETNIANINDKITLRNRT